MQGGKAWHRKITKFQSGFAKEEPDLPRVTQQFHDKAENRWWNPGLLSFLWVHHIITPLITYLPSSFSVLDRKVQTAPLTSCKSSSLHKDSCLPMGVSLSLPVRFPKEQALCSQLQGSLLSHRTVLLSFQCVGCLPLKIKFHLFVWYKENQLGYSSHC